MRQTKMPRQLLIPMIATLAVALGMFLISSASYAIEPRPLCPQCRRFIDSSPTRVHALLEIDGRERSLDVCSVFCLCECLDNRPKAELKHAQILSYNAYLDGQQTYLRARLACFLYNADGNEEVTAAPFVYAFASREDALAAQQELNGEVLEWNEVLSRCMKLAEEYEAKRPQYQRLKKRKRPESSD